MRERFGFFYASVNGTNDENLPTAQKNLKLLHDACTLNPKVFERKEQGFHFVEI